MCKKPFIDFYKKEIDELKKRYKKFVFFSSSFGSDQILDDKIYQEFIYKNLQNENLRNKKIIKNERIIENKNYESVVQLLKKLAKSNPNINFIFRPHPRQDIKKVKKRFSGIRNIFVIYKYSVTPWIKACEIFMHSGCTTVFEAISMKKKIVSFCEYKNQYRNNFSFKFGYHFSNHKDVENKIKKILSISYSKNHQLAKNYIKNTSKDNFFYKDFINYLKTIRNSNNSSHLTYQKFSNNNFKNYLVKVKSFVFRSKIIKFTYFIFNKNFLLSREYKKKKIESIKKTEIINDLNKINKIAGIKVFFKIKKLDDNLFQISKK